jgi:hypothetical protein
MRRLSLTIAVCWTFRKLCQARAATEKRPTPKVSPKPEEQRKQNVIQTPSLIAGKWTGCRKSESEPTKEGHTSRSASQRSVHGDVRRLQRAVTRWYHALRLILPGCLSAATSLILGFPDAAQSGTHAADTHGLKQAPTNTKQGTPLT